MPFRTARDILGLSDRPGAWEGLCRDVETLLDVLNAQGPLISDEILLDADVRQRVWQHPALDKIRAGLGGSTADVTITDALKQVCLDVALKRHNAFQRIVAENGRGAVDDLASKRRKWFEQLVERAAGHMSARTSSSREPDNSKRRKRHEESSNNKQAETVRSDPPPMRRTPAGHGSGAREPDRTGGQRPHSSGSPQRSRDEDSNPSSILPDKSTGAHRPTAATGGDSTMPAGRNVFEGGDLPAAVGPPNMEQVQMKSTDDFSKRPAPNLRAPNADRPGAKPSSSEKGVPTPSAAFDKRDSAAGGHKRPPNDAENEWDDVEDEDHGLGFSLHRKRSLGGRQPAPGGETTAQRERREDVQHELSFVEEEYAQATQGTGERLVVVYFSEPGSAYERMATGILEEPTILGIAKASRRPRTCFADRMWILVGPFEPGKGPTSSSHRQYPVDSDSDVEFHFRTYRANGVLQFVLEADKPDMIWSHINTEPVEGNQISIPDSVQLVFPPELISSAADMRLSMEAAKRTLGFDDPSRSRTWAAFRKDMEIVIEFFGAFSVQAYGRVPWDRDILRWAWAHPALDRLRKAGAEYETAKGALDLVCLDVAKKRRDSNTYLAADGLPAAEDRGREGSREYNFVAERTRWTGRLFKGLAPPWPLEPKADPTATSAQESEELKEQNAPSKSHKRPTAGAPDSPMAKERRDGSGKKRKGEKKTGHPKRKRTQSEVDEDEEGPIYISSDAGEADGAEEDDDVSLGGKKQLSEVDEEEDQEEVIDSTADSTKGNLPFHKNGQGRQEDIEKDWNADAQASRGQQRAGSDDEAPVPGRNPPQRSRRQGAQKKFLGGLEDYASSAKSSRRDRDTPPASAKSHKSSHRQRFPAHPRPPTALSEPQKTFVEEPVASSNGGPRGGSEPGLRNTHQRYEAFAAAELASRGVPALVRRAKEMADAEARREAEKKREESDLADQKERQNTRAACGRTTVIYYREPGSDCAKMTSGILFDATLKGLREVAQRPADAVVGRISPLTGTYVRGQKPTKDTHRKGAVVDDSNVRFCFRSSPSAAVLMFLFEADKAGSLKVDHGTVNVEGDRCQRLVDWGRRL
ncbi:MAG: hypothetical protein M1823_003792 [Watsoniomyces obsoletus]|nr:MAG: hypothetical protein M1823_003792 [Watsoniomyces obsoletus]